MPSPSISSKTFIVKSLGEASGGGRGFCHPKTDVVMRFVAWLSRDLFVFLRIDNPDNPCRISVLLRDGWKNFGRLVLWAVSDLNLKPEKPRETMIVINHSATCFPAFPPWMVGNGQQQHARTRVARMR